MSRAQLWYVHTPQHTPHYNIHNPHHYNIYTHLTTNSFAVCGILQCVLNCFELYSFVCLISNKLYCCIVARWGFILGQDGDISILPLGAWSLVSTMSKYSLTGGTLRWSLTGTAGPPPPSRGILGYVAERPLRTFLRSELMRIARENTRGIQMLWPPVVFLYMKLFV